MRSNYSNDIYKMYEEEVNKNKEKNKKIKDLELEIYVLKLKLKSYENKIKSEVEKAVKPIIKEKDNLKSDLTKAFEEINRLKNQVNNRDTNDKDSSNSSIPTSKEINHKKRTNTYNHRKNYKI